jgi:hypothetical protein
MIDGGRGPAAISCLSVAFCVVWLLVLVNPDIKLSPDIELNPGTKNVLEHALITNGSKIGGAVMTERG